MAVDPARAKSLFLNASDLADPAECAAYLERECGEDAELRGRVEALLRANEDSPAPPTGSEAVTIDSGAGRPGTQDRGVPTPNADAAPVSITALYDRNPGAEILIAGRYTLQEKIGEGGMGEVWVAKQSEPVKRKVALKLIKPGMDSRAVLARFEQERQALAMMDHPNIARVLDAGMTPNGQPFFVMELVNGLPLTKFCDELKLTPKERLELFVPICQAVQHAHQKGIVHRDLKPANILITMIDGKPVPKVIDFGVAKATAGKLTDESMSTQFGAVVGTLEYMSPEQAGFSGEDIDTRADIYSLGVILYEILTGLRPIDARRLKKAALTEMIRIIREDEPSKPSTRLSTDEALPSLAAMRQTDPRKLMSILRGDLDWVVMKCLEKHRERRYETANALARDVQRYLDGDAVEACPPSVGYRMRKFLRRNKGPVLAASFVFLALMAGFVGTAWGLFRADQARQAEAAQRQVAVEQKAKAEASEALAKAQRSRAEAQEEQAIEAVKKFRDAVANNPELKNNPALESLRKTLLKEPLAFFKALRDRLQADKDTRPEALKRLADAGFELAVLTGQIGDKRDALVAHREALAIYRKLLDGDLSANAFRVRMACSHFDIGYLLDEAGRSAEAMKSYEAARAIFRELAEADPGATEFRGRLADTLLAIGNLLSATGKPAEAMKSYKAARAIYRELAEADPGATEFRGRLALNDISIGVLLQAGGKPAEAMKSYETARAIYRELAEADPGATEFQSRLAIVHNNIGNLLGATGKPAEAMKSYEAARAICRNLAEANPTVTEFQYSLAVSHTHTGNVLRKTGNPAEALKEYESARAIFRKLADDHPDAIEFRRGLSDNHTSMGNLLYSTGKPAEALQSFESALAIRRELAEANPTVPLFQVRLADSHTSVGVMLCEAGKPAEAMDQYESALAIWRNLTQEHPESPDFASGLGGTLNNAASIDLTAKRFREARDRLREALSWQRKALATNPADPQYRRFLGINLANLLRAAQGLGDAEGVAEAESELTKLRDSDPAKMALETRLLAILKGDQKPKDNAERLQLAQRAYDKALHATAARLWAEALAADPKLGDDRQAQHRYNAACAAALAGCGKGKDDPKPDDAARAKLRKQALDWLKAELSAWKRISMTAEPGNKQLVAKTLSHWKEDGDLASIRDTQEVAKLPDDEQAAFKGFWSDVDALLNKVSGVK